ncbi:hypothetical protein HKD37_17G047953 [Glycine soja]
MSKDVRKKAHAYQKQNTTSHVLSRGGYDFLEQKLMEEKKNKLLEEAAQFGSTNIVVDPPYPIRQHDSLEKQALQGSFAAHEHQDVVTAIIGQPEHPGCVRAAGVDVMIKHYFGPASRGSCTSSSMDPKTGDSDKFELYVDDNPPQLVVLGRVYEGSTTVYNVPLGNDQMNVSVEEVRDADARVPVPTQEV